MIDEYIIINKAVIQKRIEELEKEYEKELKQPNDIMCTLSKGMIGAYKDVLSKSTPLIPVLEQAYFEGECYGIGTDACITKQDYISNLKLDI